MSLGGTVWAVTLWTAGRRPYLMTLTPRGVRLSGVGRAARNEWQAMSAGPLDLSVGEFVILPDRLRGLLHVAAALDELAVETALAWFKARLEARVGVSERAACWEPNVEAVRLESPVELVSWRRRIRAARRAGPRREPSAARLPNDCP